MGQKCGIKFRWSCDICSLLVSISKGVVGDQWKSYLKQWNYVWWDMARYSAPGYPNKHIGRGEGTHKHNWIE